MRVQSRSVAAPIAAVWVARNPMEPVRAQFTEWSPRQGGEPEGRGRVMRDRSGRTIFDDSTKKNPPIGVDDNSRHFHGMAAGLNK